MKSSDTTPAISGAEERNRVFFKEQRDGKNTSSPAFSYNKSVNKRYGVRLPKKRIVMYYSYQAFVNLTISHKIFDVKKTSGKNTRRRCLEQTVNRRKQNQSILLYFLEIKLKTASYERMKRMRRDYLRMLDTLKE